MAKQQNIAACINLVTFYIISGRIWWKDFTAKWVYTIGTEINASGILTLYCSYSTGSF